jgi:hypothetical protein
VPDVHQVRLGGRLDLADDLERPTAGGRPGRFGSDGHDSSDRSVDSSSARALGYPRTLVGMTSTEPGPEQELRDLDQQLREEQKMLDDIRYQMEDQTELPDPSDRANLIRGFEDQEAIVRVLSERRQELLKQLEGLQG